MHYIYLRPKADKQPCSLICRTKKESSNEESDCWQQCRDVSFSILVMWLEPEICAPKYWMVELMRREDEAGRCEDGQMISRTGQTDHWQSVQGWRETGNNGDCWCMKWPPTLSNEEGNKRASNEETQNKKFVDNNSRRNQWMNQLFFLGYWRYINHLLTYTYNLLTESTEFLHCRWWQHWCTSSANRQPHRRDCSDRRR